jgi:hypothetical protein
MLDSWTAIILALAAVATAWASSRASQWSGTQSDAQSASSTARSDAGRAASEATGDEIVDSQMWLSWLSATAQRQWLIGAQFNANGDAVVIPQGTPMNLPAYIVPNEATSRVLAVLFAMVCSSPAWPPNARRLAFRPC